MSWTKSNSIAVRVLSLNLANHGLLPSTPRDLPSPPIFVPEYHGYLPKIATTAKIARKLKYAMMTYISLAFNYKIEITKHWGRGTRGIKVT